MSKPPLAQWALSQPGPQCGPQLGFALVEIEPLLSAAAPHLSFTLAIKQDPIEQNRIEQDRLEQDRAAAPMPIDCAMLQVQIRIEPARRAYNSAEQAALDDLFGPPELWSRSLKSRLWAQCPVMVGSFERATRVKFPVPCSFDFNLAATKYLAALADSQGEVALSLLFSGTVFYRDPQAGLQTAPIAWDREASFRMPLETWRRMIAHYHPDTRWLEVGGAVFERLRRYQAAHGLSGWDQVLGRLLTRAGEPS